MILWGGVVALALEHVAHEEVVPYPPFLSAMGSASDTATMLQEMGTIGVGMLIACVALWAGMILVYNMYTKKVDAPQTA